MRGARQRKKFIARVGRVPRQSRDSLVRVIGLPSVKIVPGALLSRRPPPRRRPLTSVIFGKPSSSLAGRAMFWMNGYRNCCLLHTHPPPRPRIYFYVYALYPYPFLFFRSHRPLLGFITLHFFLPPFRCLLSSPPSSHQSITLCVFYIPCRVRLRRSHMKFRL